MVDKPPTRESARGLRYESIAPPSGLREGRKPGRWVPTDVRSRPHPSASRARTWRCRGEERRRSGYRWITCMPASVGRPGAGLKRRLRRSTSCASATVGDGSVGGAGTVELALQASASQPLVTNILRRVTRRRLELVTKLYVELGLSPARARQRALLAYTAYLGHAQLAHATPDLLPHGRTLANHVDQVVETLVGLGE